MPALRKEIATVLVGLVLIGLAAVGAAATIQLVSVAPPGGAADVTAFGLSLGRWSSSTLLWVTAGVAVGGGVALVLGAWALATARRRRAERERDRLDSEVERLKTMKRLLEEEVDFLHRHVAVPVPIGRAAVPRRSMVADDLVVLPEAPPVAPA